MITNIDNPDILIPENFRGFPSLKAGFTTRHLGGDFARLSARLGVSLDAIVSLKQIHSNRVIDAEDVSGHSSTSLEGDALVSRAPGIVLAVKTADCVPILFYDPASRATAAVHAGWRGLAAGIIEETLKWLRNDAGASNALEVAIGPCICGACFEIGPEVARVFEDKFGDTAQLRRGAGDRFHLDLVAACRRVLVNEGVRDVNVSALNLCTSCRTDLFYSYRKEGGQTGRLISFIG